MLDEVLGQLRVEKRETVFNVGERLSSCNNWPKFDLELEMIILSCALFYTFDGLLFVCCGVEISIMQAPT